MPDNQQNLQGKTALITGAAQRLGRTLALSLAQEGVHPVLHYNHSVVPVETLAQEIQAMGISCWTLQADFTLLEDTQRFFDQAMDLAGPIDILINNASAYTQETLWQTTRASLRDHMAIHAEVPFELSRCLALQKRAGHIINLLDTRAICRDPQHLAYHLGKRTLLTLTRLLAEELAPQVVVNGVAPGLILPPEGKGPEYLEQLAHTNPLHTHGTPADIAETMLFLLRSRFITGQIIYVDGGHHMKGRLYE